MMNPKRLTEGAVRKLVERQLQTKISDEVWRYAVDERIVSEYQEAPSRLNWVVGKIARLIDLERGPKPAGYVELDRRQRRVKRMPSRQEAISCYVAADARQEEAVKWFRKKFLNDQLLKFEEVEPWIAQQKETYPYRHAVIVRLPAGTTVQPEADQYSVTPALPEISRCEGLVPVTLLDYQRPGSEWVHRAPAGPDGPLGHLQKISQSLAETYGWQRAQATMFILTDLTPEIPASSVSVVGRGLGGLTRIRLEFDPFLTPAEVAQLYKPFRSRILRGRTKGLSEKHTCLAIHVLEHPNRDQECLQSWNKQYPRWAYSTLKRFNKESKVAQQRLEYTITNWRIHPGKLVAS